MLLKILDLKIEFLLHNQITLETIKLLQNYHVVSLSGNNFVTDEHIELLSNCHHDDMTP